MELVCKGRVPSEKKLNVYRLETTGMCGDADGYNENSITFGVDEVDRLEEYLILIDAVLNAYSDEENVVRKAVIEAGKDLSFKYPEDAYLDLVGNDQIYDQWAVLDDVKIIFVDKEGSEFYYDAPAYRLR